MIIKSMSRKEPSFAQLTAYMTDEKSDRDFDLHQHVFSRDPEHIAHEFETNARLLAKRKNGNYLYHEILSLDTRQCGQGREVKEKLRLLALDYVARRCPQNMAFGAMHQDHEGHLHYHLMISANELGDRRRLRLPKATYEAAKRETERQALEDHPELMQAKVMTASNREKAQSRETRKSRKAQEMEKRGAKLSKKEQLAQELSGMMAYAGSQAEFERLLQDKGFTFYQRGKNFGIRPMAQDGSGKKPKAHRFATLGVQEAYEAFLDRTEVLVESGRVEGEKQKERAEVEVEKTPEERGSGGVERDADNDSYVKYDSNTDLNGDTSKQENEAERAQKDDTQSSMSNQEDAFRQEMLERRAKQAETKQQSRGPKGRNR